MMHTITRKMERKLTFLCINLHLLQIYKHTMMHCRPYHRYPIIISASPFHHKIVLAHVNRRTNFLKTGEIMSYCREEGKDRVIFVTAEDHSSPSKVALPDEEDEQVGLIKPSGEINWDCPCLQGMADGPCGEPFKAAFSCFHYSEEEVKGSDCVPQFRDMQICFSKYPEIYGKDDEDENEGGKDEHSDNLESIEDKDIEDNNNTESENISEEEDSKSISSSAS